MSSSSSSRSTTPTLHCHPRRHPARRRSLRRDRGKSHRAGQLRQQRGAGSPAPLGPVGAAASEDPLAVEGLPLQVRACEPEVLLVAAVCEVARHVQVVVGFGHEVLGVLLVWEDDRELILLVEVEQVAVALLLAVHLKVQLLSHRDARPPACCGGLRRLSRRCFAVVVVVIKGDVAQHGASRELLLPLSRGEEDQSRRHLELQLRQRIELTPQGHKHPLHRAVHLLAEPGACSLHRLACRARQRVGATHQLCDPHDARHQRARVEGRRFVLNAARASTLGLLLLVL
eukprot:scaffold73318_cov75-Phaeocystis_antarctica.AAC.5